MSATRRPSTVAGTALAGVASPPSAAGSMPLPVPIVTAPDLDARPTAGLVIGARWRHGQGPREFDIIGGMVLRLQQRSRQLRDALAPKGAVSEHRKRLEIAALTT